jgi:hypothetical protein
MKLFRVTTIEALGPRKRVHSATDWIVQASDAGDAERQLLAKLDDGWGAKVVHISKPREFGECGPLSWHHFTMSQEDVQKRIAKSEQQKSRSLSALRARVGSST